MHYYIDINIDTKIDKKMIKPTCCNNDQLIATIINHDNMAQMKNAIVQYLKQHDLSYYAQDIVNIDEKSCTQIYNLLINDVIPKSYEGIQYILEEEHDNPTICFYLAIYYFIKSRYNMTMSLLVALAKTKYPLAHRILGQIFLDGTPKKSDLLPKPKFEKIYRKDHDIALYNFVQYHNFHKKIGTRFGIEYVVIKGNPKWVPLYHNYFLAIYKPRELLIKNHEIKQSVKMLKARFIEQLINLLMASKRTNFNRNLVYIIVQKIYDHHRNLINTLIRNVNDYLISNPHLLVKNFY